MSTGRTLPGHRANADFQDISHLSRTAGGRRLHSSLTRKPATRLGRLAATLATGLCLSQVAGLAARAGSLTPDSNIVGLKTTMSPEQVKQSIQQQFGTSSFPPKTIKFGIPEYSRDVVLGFTGDILSKGGKEANQKQTEELNKAVQQRRAQGCNSALCQIVAGDLLKDNIDVYVDPNGRSSGVLALVRHATYPKGSDILETVFIQSLADKFGKPFFVNNFHGYYWADGMGADQINRTNNADFNACSQFSEDVANLQVQFPRLMNGFGSNAQNAFGKLRTKQPKCTMYLSVGYSAVPKVGGDFNTKYITEFSMALVNVTNSYNALNPYAGEFWTAAEKARQQTLSSQSQNKPHL